MSTGFFSFMRFESLNHSKITSPGNWNLSTELPGGKNTIQNFISTSAQKIPCKIRIVYEKS